MNGKEMLAAYTAACMDTLYEKEWRAREELERELLRRLNAYDAAMDARAAEQFISQAMASAATDSDFFTAVVNRINLDAAKIAELEAKLHNAWGLNEP